jgi:hypothetical protein
MERHRIGKSHTIQHCFLLVFLASGWRGRFECTLGIRRVENEVCWMMLNMKWNLYGEANRKLNRDLKIESLLEILLAN